MSGQDPSRGASLEVSRQRVVDTLMEHFANDVVDMDEFERRVDLANRCGSDDELRALLADLPSTTLPVPAAEVLPARGGAAVVVDADRVKENGFLISVCGGVSRKGRWIPARRTFVIGIMGGQELDFREALLGPGVTEVNVFVMLGGVEIIVPPQMDVEVSGMAIMGGFEHETDVPLRRDPDRPVLRISGLAVLGGASVQVRLLGETARQAKKRRRLERKGLQPRLTPGRGE